MSVTYTAVLDVSEDSVLFLSGLLHAERVRLGTRTGTRRWSGLGQGRVSSDGVRQVAGQQELRDLGEAPPVAVRGEGPDEVELSSPAFFGPGSYWSYATSWLFNQASWTSCGVRYPSPEWILLEL